MKGYLIELSIGEYDDYRTTPLKVFINKTKAENYIEKYNRLLINLKSFYISWCNENPYSGKPDDWDGFIIHEKMSYIRDRHQAIIIEIDIIN